MRVGVVTFEFAGLTKNGGIGTAYTRLANLLVKHGHHVTVFFVDISNQTSAAAHLDNSKMSLKVIKVPESLDRSHSWAGARSIAVYEELLNHKLDILHFHDCLGIGWATLMAKKQGLAFENTEVIMGMHGPNFWVNDAHGFLSNDPFVYLESRIEKMSVELSSTVVSPSQYMIDYLKSFDWIFPENTRVIQNVHNLDFITPSKKKTAKKEIKFHSINRLIFFGRLESRKGILLFLDSLKLLYQQKYLWTQKLSKNRLDIVFLGKDTLFPDGRWATQIVNDFLKPMTDLFHFEFHKEFSSEDCRNYFETHPDSLVCFPSLADNSPYVLVEALEQNLNFVATNVGGQKELLHTDSITDSLASTTSENLCKKIIGKITGTYRLAQPSGGLVKSNTSWIELHKNIKPINNHKTSRRSHGKKPTFAIIVRTSGDFQKLKDTLTTIDAQRNCDKNVFIYNTGPSNKAKEVLLKNLVLKSKFKTFNFINAFGSSLKNCIGHCLSVFDGDWFLILEEGDLIGPDAFLNIQTVLQKNTALIYVFGFEVDEVRCYPLPADINYTLFFDSYDKFPAVYSRQWLNGYISNPAKHQLFNSEDLLRAEIIGDSVLIVPYILIYSECRKPFNAYHLAERETIRSRLKQIQQHLPTTFRRSVEMSVSFLLSQRST